MDRTEQIEMNCPPKTPPPNPKIQIKNPRIVTPRKLPRKK
jgi:hypothetical protein